MLTTRCVNNPGFEDVPGIGSSDALFQRLIARLNVFKGRRILKLQGVFNDTTTRPITTFDAHDVLVEPRKPWTCASDAVASRSRVAGSVAVNWSRVSHGLRRRAARLVRAVRRRTPRRLYAKPCTVADDAPVHWYHSMVLPESGEVTGEWDLRANVDQYLGRVDLRGKRVLEIGPASGYLTFEMERRGADVVCVELPPGAPFDMVPYVSIDQSAELAGQGDSLLPLHNGFWRAHAELRSRARVHHGDAMNLPKRIGMFDVSIVASVLQHLHDPIAVVRSCAERTRETIVITDLDATALTGVEIEGPVLELYPTTDPVTPFTWWKLRPRFFEVLLGILGFDDVVTTYHDDRYVVANRDLTSFTVVGHRRTR